MTSMVAAVPVDAAMRAELLASGLAHQQARRYGAAERCFRVVLGQDPNDREALAALGALALQVGNPSAALPLLELATRSGGLAGNTSVQYNLGMAYVLAGRFEEAQSAFEQVIASAPAHGPALASLGNLQRFLGRHHDAWRSYRAAIDGGNLDATLFSQVLVSAHSHADLEPATVFALHCEWARRFAAPDNGQRPPFEASATRRLRVGFVSQNFAGTILASFLRTVVPELAQHVALHLYDAGPVDNNAPNANGLPLPRSVTRHRIGQQGDAAAAERIRRDRIDVLVDLAGHTPGHRLLLFARRPAPLQLTWLDYFDTTGLPAIDGIVTDAVSSPEALVTSGAQRFVETPLRMPHSRLCYALPQAAPEVAALPASATGRVTFGCFGRADKIDARVTHAWAAILERVPGSRILLKGPAYGIAAVRDRCVRAFGACGIEAERIAFEGPVPHGELLQAYARVDIALDTFPYNGGATTCDALAMGVPVVTLAGRSMIARQGASLLHAAGCAAWVAEDVESYVAIAVRLAHDLPVLASVRAGLRTQLAASPLCDAVRFARDFADLVAAAWRTRRVGSAAPSLDAHTP